MHIWGVTDLNSIFALASASHPSWQGREESLVRCLPVRRVQNPFECGVARVPTRAPTHGLNHLQVYRGNKSRIGSFSIHDFGCSLLFPTNIFLDFFCCVVSPTWLISLFHREECHWDNFFLLCLEADHSASTSASSGSVGPNEKPSRRRIYGRSDTALLGLQGISQNAKVAQIPIKSFMLRAINES